MIGSWGDLELLWVVLHQQIEWLKWATPNNKLVMKWIQNQVQHHGYRILKGCARSELGLEVYSRLFSVLGSQDREYWLGPGGKPHKFPLDMDLDMLQILLMSYPTPCMVLSWALGNLGSMSNTLHGFVLGPLVTWGRWEQELGMNV